MGAATTKPMGPAEWGLLAALSVLWGGSFVFAKVAVADLPPLTVVLGRVALAATALNLLVVAARHRMPLSGRAWAAFLVMGLLNNVVPFALIFWGTTRIAGGLAAVLNSTTPLFTAALAHLLTADERLTPGRLAGVLLGVAGVAVLIGPAALGGLGDDLLPQLAVLGAALSYGLAAVYGRRFRGTPPLVTSAGQLTVATALTLPAVAALDRPWTLPPPGAGAWAALLALGLLSTALAYILYFRLLAAAGATNSSLVTLLIPVTTLALGAAVLGERPHPRQVGGMALIALGLAATDGRPLRLARRLAPRPPDPPAAGSDYHI